MIENSSNINVDKPREERTRRANPPPSRRRAFPGRARRLARADSA
jgi:hypothetical protein